MTEEKFKKYQDINPNARIRLKERKIFRFNFLFQPVVQLVYFFWTSGSIFYLFQPIVHLV